MSEIESEIQYLTGEIEGLLRQVAQIKHITNPELIFDLKGIRGNGFLGEFFLGSVRNKDTNEEVHVAIKKAFRNKLKRSQMNLEKVYKNEVYFYATVYPELSKFQSERTVTSPFHNVANFLCAKLDAPNESLVLDDITKQGYIMREKSLLLDDEHVRFIFKTYGKFHGLSYALKDQDNELYKKLADEAIDIFKMFTELKNEGVEGFSENVDKICKNVLELLDTEDNAELIKVARKYLENASAEFNKSLEYKGNFETITHGDCWSSNMMFKYTDDGKLEDMKLIDFQIVRPGTPVYDLSYFFYTGGNKELFDNLDEYLKVYHESLSTNIRELGSDPEKLYPFKQLKEDWKNYGMFGTIFSLMLTKVKLLKSEDVQDIVSDREVPGNKNQFIELKINEKLFKTRTRDIVESAVKVGIFS